MENKTYMTPFGGKNILRSTGEEVEIIDCEIKLRGDRSDEDWVTYIDSNGKEHIREHLNIQLDFKPIVSDTWNKLLDYTKSNKLPTTRNCRIFEVAKEILLKDWGMNYKDAVENATKFVDEVGIETE